MRISLTALAFACCLLQNAVSFAPKSQIALKTGQRSQEGVLFAVSNHEEEEKSTALFSAISPDNEDNNEKTSPAPKEGNDNSFDLTTIGTQAAAVLFAALVFLGATSLAMDMATSAAGALGNELVKETQNLLGHVVWALGAVGSAVAGAAWEGTKIAAPAVGQAVVEGAKVAGPLVQEATRQVSEAAAPVLQEAGRQVTEAAAPYVDSVSSAVTDSVSNAASTVDSTLVAPLNTAVDSVNSAVDSSLVAPIKDAAETVSNTVESVNSKVDETLVAPIKSVGDAIKGFKIF